MAFRPLKDDAEIEGIIEDLSRVSERCAVCATMFNQAKDELARVKARQQAEQANNLRKQTKERIKEIINARVSSAYNAGIQDAIRQEDRQSHQD